MGMQGSLLATSAVFGGPAADQGGFGRLTLIAASVAMVAFLSGCSSSSSPFGRANNPNPNQAAGVAAPPNYSATAAAQPAYPPPPGASGQPSYAPPPNQQSYAAPAAATSDADLAANAYPYPKQSLVELFRSDSQAAQAQQAQTVPRPPSTYNPSQQPYSPPPGQQQTYSAPAGSTAVAAAAPPPASTDPADSLPYPKQSLFDLFSNK
jgi:hypothetical protein